MSINSPMQKTPSEKIKSFTLFLCCATLAVYCFIAFIPIPEAISTNLDPSWEYAISHAAVDKLIFGKDIIFTYGSFGYLIGGAALEQNFFSIVIFRLIVYVALFITIFIKTVNLKTSWQKVALSLSLLFLLLMGRSTDYKILIVFLIILSLIDSFPRNLSRWLSLGLGAFAGFCLLTKFSLGIATVGSLVLFLLANLYFSVKSNSGRTISLFALINSFLAAISVSFILLSPAY